MTMERVHATSLADYFEILTKAVFQSGLSWKVVEAKWEGFREAFKGFDPKVVADFSPEDVERLLADKRIIRNRRKVEATVENADAILAIQREYGGFDKYLDAQGDHEATVADLERRFRHLGDTGAWYFLAVLGRPVPDWTIAHPGDTWAHGAHHHGRRAGAAAR